MQAIRGFTLHILVQVVSMSILGPWLFENLENKSTPVPDMDPYAVTFFMNIHTSNCYFIDFTFSWHDVASSVN